MYKLLIVDDEPEIVDWLYDMFQENQALELDIYKAYSGRQAMELLIKTRFDVALLDIRMPGINGMQLMEKIRSLWPECKIVFLTGFNEFDYIYTAIHQEGVNFLLKTEEDDEIIKAVEKAVLEIEKGHIDEELMNKAKQQMSLTMPLLQKEFLHDLLYGNLSDEEISETRLSELELPLHFDSPVMLLIGRGDNIPSEVSSYQKSQYYFAVKVIVEQYFSGVFNGAHVVSEHANLVWLYQLKALNDVTAINTDIDTWNKAVVFVKETLESVQSACKESLGLTFSFVVGSEPVQLGFIPGRYKFIMQLLDYRIGQGKEMILTEKSLANDEAEKGLLLKSPLQNAFGQLKKLGALSNYLERGQKKEFYELLPELIECLRGVTSKNYNPALEIYYSISLMFLSYVNRWNLTEKISVKIGLNLLVRIDEHRNWIDAVEYLYSLSKILFELQEEEQEKRAIDVISRVQQFIHAHLGEDLSLTRLAEVAYFNPSYLSRLFKQVLGKNITEYICVVRINKAKDLLENSSMRVQEIAVSVGYESSHYFARFFKKATNMTPQEYRETVH